MLSINMILEETKAFISEIICHFKFNTKIQIEGIDECDVIDKINGNIFDRSAVERDISLILHGTVDFEREDIELTKTGENTYEANLVWRGYRNFTQEFGDSDVSARVEDDVNCLLPVFEAYLQNMNGFELLNTTRALVDDVVEI